MICDFTENRKCSNCGSCCTNFIPVSPYEIAQIKEFVKKHKIKEETQPYLAYNAVNLLCPFRDEMSHKCKIYKVRPAICRAFVCCDPEEKIKENRDFLQSRYGCVDLRKTIFEHE